MPNNENDGLRQLNLIAVHDVMILLLWMLSTGGNKFSLQF